MRLLAFVSCLVVVLISRPAFAGDSGFYVAPSVGAVLFSGSSKTIITPDSGSVGLLPVVISGGTAKYSTSHSANRQSLRIGYHITRMFALELEGARVGKWSQSDSYQANNIIPDSFSGSSVTFHETEVGVNAILTVPLGHGFALQGGVGAARVRYSVDGVTYGGLTGLTISSVTSDTQYKAELAATYQFARRVALRASVEEYFPQTRLFYPKPHMTGLTLGVVVDL